MQTHDLNAEQAFRSLREHCLYISTDALRAAIYRAEELLAIRRLTCVEADVYFILIKLAGLSTGTALNVLRRLRAELLPQPIIKTNTLTIYGLRAAEDKLSEEEWNALERAVTWCGFDMAGGAA